MSLCVNCHARGQQKCRKCSAQMDVCKLCASKHTCGVKNNVELKAMFEASQKEREAMHKRVAREKSDIEIAYKQSLKALQDNYDAEMNKFRSASLKQSVELETLKKKLQEMEADS